MNTSSKNTKFEEINKQVTKFEDMEELRKEFFCKFADWHNMDIEDVWSWIESKIVQAKEAGREEERKRIIDIAKKALDDDKYWDRDKGYLQFKDGKFMDLLQELQSKK